MQKDMAKEEFIPLTMENFNSVFRDKFKEYALTCGRAGRIIIHGVDDVMRVPRRDMREMHMVLIDGQMVERENPEGLRLFSDNVRGDRLYEKYERDYEVLMEGKKKLMFKLLSSADPSVKSAMTTSPGYAAMFDAYDIHGLWRLTEQVCLGTGAISVYTLIARLLQLNQRGSYNDYQKDFKRLVMDLRNQGEAHVVLDKIFNALFILGLDQEQFRDKLAIVYGTRDWPGYEALSAELHTYVESKLRMSELRKDNNEGKITANVAKEQRRDGSEKRMQCWNCGSYDHRRSNCDKPLARCGKCRKEGHLEKFCRYERSFGNSNDGQEPEKRKNVKTEIKAKKNSSFAMKKKGNKMNSKTRLISKVLAHLINADDNDEEEDNEEVEDNDAFGEDSNYVADEAGDDDDA